MPADDQRGFATYLKKLDDLDRLERRLGDLPCEYREPARRLIQELRTKYELDLIGEGDAPTF